MHTVKPTEDALVAGNFDAEPPGKHAVVLRPSCLPFFFHSFPFRGPSALRSCSSSLVAVAVVKRIFALRSLLRIFFFYCFCFTRSLPSVCVLCVRHRRRRRRPCRVTTAPWLPTRVYDIIRRQIFCTRLRHPFLAHKKFKNIPFKPFQYTCITIT